MKTFRSNGKLLISGEYVVLDGAKALALPTKYGQSLSVEENSSNKMVWQSHDENGDIWYEDMFSINDGQIQKRSSTDTKNDNEISHRLVQILKATQDLNPEFLSSHKGYTIVTHQDFNRKWGLGTSSTLINNIANWANVDAYRLLHKTFGGSGYDIACAQHSSPLTYELGPEAKPKVNTVSFNPNFKDQLYFVYLNQKQNSRDGIKAYRSLGKVDNSIIAKINQLTEAMIVSSSRFDFEDLLTEHEHIIAELIKQPTLKSKLFSDFDGAIKSLGAWGGDFILVSTATNPRDYFNSKGFDTIIPFDDMIL